jgi:hypothetical protein
MLTSRRAPELGVVLRQVEAEILSVHQSHPQVIWCWIYHMCGHNDMSEQVALHVCSYAI